MERRSLRKHSERVHGVVLPLLYQRKRTALNKKNFNKANQVSSAISKENNNSEKFYDEQRFVWKDYCKDKTYQYWNHYFTIYYIDTVCYMYIMSTKRQRNIIKKTFTINYHRIRSSSSEIEKLESSLLIKTKTSSGDKKID